MQLVSVLPKAVATTKWVQIQYQIVRLRLIYLQSKINTNSKQNKKWTEGKGIIFIQIMAEFL